LLPPYEILIEFPPANHGTKQIEFPHVATIRKRVSPLMLTPNEAHRPTRNFPPRPRGLPEIYNIYTYIAACLRPSNYLSSLTLRELPEIDRTAFIDLAAFDLIETSIDTRPALD